MGGGEIYRESLKDIDFIYLIRIPGNYSDDTTYSLSIPHEFKFAFSQFSEQHLGLRYEIWSKERFDLD